ncbi:class I SAM-dependent methyltransferase [Kitasatospora sp. DSM 101779]|uniref:class I SAM-dependent methyltransferase n=1 Tax=Kitasatospora sp. DSM 101779 TaxID=2853165 RepID=UPI0021DAB0E3|nr:class I SAM-dependent methyltransferase [Kitasatospora sp. DSM 101779]MCU7822021.1 class I SAM-dependent methyltransferase [Kitasatospora sp. DSM 101779]
MTASATEIQSRTLAGYADASRLRQVHDRDWVLDRLPGEPQILVDLGSGIGQLLQAALERFPSIRLAAGLERSEHRIAEAADRLRAHGARVVLHRADLTDPEPLPLHPDAVTMTSVLHWLFPYEERIFAWVAGRLAPGGRFLLTTYHPARDEHGFGGEDEIVREALAALGTPRADVPALFAREGVLPIATRTRTVDDLAGVLRPHLAVADHQERDAVVTVESAEQYAHFHAATFGDYYSRLVPAERRADFFRAVGEAARQRQADRGHVSRMPVRLWELTTH